MWLHAGVEGRPTGPNCYLGTRLEALHNHLFPDPFHLSSVYYFTSRGHLLRTAYSQVSHCPLYIEELHLEIHNSIHKILSALDEHVCKCENVNQIYYILLRKMVT